MYLKTAHPSPIGTLTLASNGESLIGLWMEGQKYHGDSIYKDMQKKEDLLVFDATKRWLDEYFRGKKPNLSELPLAPIGSVFRLEVWDLLRQIPYGEIITYGDVAKKMAIKRNKEKMSSRAVGGAVGHNPISIIIPCHRVVGTNGNLTGFSAGVKTKIKLLELEGVDISRLHVPTLSNTS